MAVMIFKCSAMVILTRSGVSSRGASRRIEKKAFHCPSVDLFDDRVAQRADELVVKSSINLGVARCQIWLIEPVFDRLGELHVAFRPCLELHRGDS